MAESVKDVADALRTANLTTVELIAGNFDGYKELCTSGATWPKDNKGLDIRDTFLANVNASTWKDMLEMETGDLRRLVKTWGLKPLQVKDIAKHVDWVQKGLSYLQDESAALVDPKIALSYAAALGGGGK
eukprot:g2151.t1